jgi:hypothetical protein
VESDLYRPKRLRATSSRGALFGGRPSLPAVEV